MAEVDKTTTDVSFLATDPKQIEVLSQKTRCGTTLFFSSKILFFHISLDFWKFDVFSSNFSSIKMLFIDGAILQLKFYEFREINYTTSRNIH